MWSLNTILTKLQKYILKEDFQKLYESNKRIQMEPKLNDWTLTTAILTANVPLLTWLHHKTWRQMEQMSHLILKKLLRFMQVRESWSSPDKRGCFLLVSSVTAQYRKVWEVVHNDYDSKEEMKKSYLCRIYYYNNNIVIPKCKVLRLRRKICELRE